MTLLSYTCMYSFLLDRSMGKKSSKGKTSHHFFSNNNWIFIWVLLKRLFLEEEDQKKIENFSSFLIFLLPTWHMTSSSSIDWGNSIHTQYIERKVCWCVVWLWIILVIRLYRLTDEAVHTNRNRRRRHRREECFHLFFFSFFLLFCLSSLWCLNEARKLRNAWHFSA